MHLHREVLGLPLFETATEGCRKLLSLRIRTNFCVPDEYLIHKGDALQNIYYLFNGSMEVVQDGKVILHSNQHQIVETPFLVKK